MIQFIQLIAQLFLLAGLWYFSNELVIHLHIPVSAGVIGFVILLLLLSCRIIPVKFIKLGTDFLLAEMLLFFIPIVVGIARYKELFIHDGFKLLLAIVLGTIFVMLMVGVTVEIAIKLKQLRKK